MTKVAALELASMKIRVNAVLPGTTDTAMVRAAAGATRSVEEMAVNVPLGKRLVRPEEVGNMVLFLASDASSMCTGGDFIVDGGKTARIA